MSVLAEEVWSVDELLHFVCLLAYLVYLFLGRIHLARHIIGFLLGMYRALIVHRQSRELLQVIVFLVGVMCAACLVAKAPHHDRRMHLIPLIKPCRAVNVAIFPCRIIADAVVAWRKLHNVSAVRLYVCFVYYEDAELIAHLEEIWIRRIVRSPHRIYVVLLAELHITLYLFRRHVIAIRRRCIMVVNTVEFDFPVVYEELVSPNDH